MRKLTRACGCVCKGENCRRFLKGLEFSLGRNQWDLLHINGLFGIINEENYFAEILNYFFG